MDASSVHLSNESSVSLYIYIDCIIEHRIAFVGRNMRLNPWVSVIPWEETKCTTPSSRAGQNVCHECSKSLFAFFCIQWYEPSSNILFVELAIERTLKRLRMTEPVATNSSLPLVLLPLQAVKSYPGR